MATTTISDINTVVSEVEIAAPPERVFQALTQSAQLLRWWTSDEGKAELWEMDARPGGHWRARHTCKATSINGTNLFETRGEILEIDPPRLLVYTWKADWDPPGTTSVVCWELTSTGNVTKVKMTHRGLTPELAQGYSGGWPTVLELLKKFAEQ